MDYAHVFRKSTKGPSNRRGWELLVQLTPKASQSKLGEVCRDANGQNYLKVYVTAAPEDNKANKALLNLLSKEFQIPKTNLLILSGQTYRRKVIWFGGDELPSLKTR
ncbi:MAG: DUF167 domain-containing protein [Alphaproteobacteria bacterium]|nr:DUF167 domain-containing protein [Alphaproteobacteria bacterium]